jgi:glycosyltransferase involved in cell wall biosynthesis
MKLYKKYIMLCKRLKKNSNNKQKNSGLPYLSIILPVYNMEKYIERALLSILNQSFQDFEIIIVNDFSKDNTKQIIKKYKKNEEQIRIIEHNQNLGIYTSRVDGILNSKGQYILLIDPDDIILNPFLFQKIYELNKKYNLDIIEFVVYYQEERNNII